MNSKAYLIPFAAFLAVLLVGFASAQLVNNTTSLVSPSSVSGIATAFNDVLLSDSQTVIAGTVGDTVPVRITFTALNDASNVRVKVWMDGYRSDISASTTRFDLVSGSVYTKLLSLNLPSDLDTTTQTFTLHVSVANENGYNSANYIVKMQRDSYSMNVLSVDFPTQVAAGDNVPVSVVVTNNGMHTLDNGYVTVSIPTLGLSSKVYLGDTSPVDNCSDNCDMTDSVQKTVYVKIPESTTTGVYQVQVNAYNADATTTVSKMISVSESAATNVLAAVKNQDIRAGETKNYDVIVVNSGNTVKVFNVQTVSGSALSVSAPSFVTVGPQSSATIPVAVTASNKADVGSYTFTVTVDGKQTVLGANVVQGSASSSVLVLTVVLAVIFLILLVVLIVLLFKKEKSVETVETSYY